MEIIVNSKIELRNVPLSLSRLIRERLTMPNPKFQEANKMGRWTGNIDKELRFYQTTPDGVLILPRGFALHLLRLATHTETSWRIIDQRLILPEVPFTFQGELRGYQQKAVGDVLMHDFGVLNAATGSGKTTMALAAIAARRQPTLIIVHTKELMQQWIDRACQFLGMKQEEIGQIGSGKKKIGDRLTVGIVNSIYPIADEMHEKIGFLIVDEAHHCPSRTFSEAVSAFDSKFMLGLSATPYRRDGLSRLIYWYIGDQVHQVDKGELIQEGSIMKPKIITRRTEFSSSYDLTADYSKGISELTMSHSRNSLIADDVMEYLRENAGPCLVLSDRKSHCELLANMLTDKKIKTAILTGNLSTIKRNETFERIRAGEVQAICATGSLVGEGFDLPALSAMFMATPIKFSGRVTQYIGRVLRPAPGKDHAIIFDYIDILEPVLSASAKTRMKVYEKAA